MRSHASFKKIPAAEQRRPDLDAKGLRAEWAVRGRDRSQKPTHDCVREDEEHVRKKVTHVYTQKKAASKA